ncbi:MULTISPECIES: C40 family peptidase [unclassified Gilliamella]|uniref:C40 family peptidase n=1 Tax=unclassified Gilliamella TaxID=2685620 RepID=UPI0009C0CBC4|nr:MULTISPECIES: NlpC/P60 family protein [Gilliamella]MCX8582440.1 C40 family peptidase [Gilliamella sp. B3372]MCX8594476.1 C40 family peptidase [Gilliamella sp. B3367]MCX8661420.1 C40 family peptidase [Gilliamella sp. B2772]MCX8663159.1 C40 family peptidase [Gilliamella sp. B2911]MCX8671187.1 C40 family peptidase [Gilliamella sp. B2785]
MTRKDNRLLTKLRSSCGSVKKRLLVSSLILSLFVLFGCSSSHSQVSVKSDPVMLAKIEQHYSKWKRTPYRYGGTTLAGSDCSGLVMNFYKNRLQKTLPRSAAEQAKLGYKVTTPKAGDLVFFKTGRSRSGLHVGIYYADGKFLHASTSKGVIYSNLNEDYWKKHYWMTRRVTGR